MYFVYDTFVVVYFFSLRGNKMFSLPLPANKTIKFHILLLLPQIDDLDVVPAGFEIVPQQVVEGTQGLQGSQDAGVAGVQTVDAPQHLQGFLEGNYALLEVPRV